MKPQSLRKPLAIALAIAAIGMPLQQAIAEDIDLFVGSTSTATNPNILVILDNSANWSAASQHWPGGLMQGQSELRALNTVLTDIRPADAASSKVNLGLMMMADVNGAIQGSYIRYHVRPMTQAYVDALQGIISNDACTDGDYTVPALPSGSAVPIPKCIYKNFNGPFEKAGNSDYSGALFEAFKYFGGYTDVAHAQADVAGVPPAGAASPHTFGITRRAGTIPASTTSADYKKFDRAAYTNDTKSSYVSPITSTNSCAKNYIIFIGNGLPSAEHSQWDTELLLNVNQSTAQLSMPQFSSVTNNVTSIIGTACGTGNNASARVADCLANSTALQAANPADSYTCINPRLNTAPCTGAKNALLDVQSTKSIFTVTPTGTFAAPTVAGRIRYADEWAKFLATTDVSSVSGQQTVSTYTIDVFKDAQDADQTALLMSMARYGGGKYLQATSESAIIDALRRILVEIQSVNTVFASASLPINATNRSQNENQVFIGMFRPDSGARPRWYGNLKRYQIALFSGSAKLADADGAEAVGATGFIGPCARSFWTSDTGNYWNFSQAGVNTFAGLCTADGFSLFSDSPDGPQVEKGAVAEVLRLGNVPAYANANLPNATPIVTPTPAAVNRTLLTCANTNTTTTFDNALITCNTTTALHAFNNTNIANFNALRAADNTERDRIINFASGQDYAADQADLNQNLSTNDVRPDVHGDVAHSRPLPVNYGGATGVVLFYGANDATLRAVQGSSGKELWAFIAPEHHARLKRMRDNAPSILYPSTTVNLGISSPGTLAANDVVTGATSGATAKVVSFTPSTGSLVLSTLTGEFVTGESLRVSGVAQGTVSTVPTIWPAIKDYFFDGSAGLYQTFNTDNTSNTAWLFPSMRRGGRMLYGFNVTDPAAPRLLWRKGCPLNHSDTGCDSGFANIGQTWSIPAITKIRGYDSGNTPVLIVGGGYDSCEDSDTAVTTCSSPKGRSVYILNAQTGAIIKQFGAGGTGTIDRSVPSDITLVDRSSTGYAQHAYVADSGGNLYRIDFVDPANPGTTRVAADWTITKIARTNVTNAGRKFLFPPAALPAADRVYLTITTGDRERPLITNYPYTTLNLPTSGQLGVQNRAYMFIDTFRTTGTPVDLDGSTMNNFTTDTGCGQALTTGASGWYFDFTAGRGEQGVTSSLIFSGLAFFSTNRPLSDATTSCINSLGEARGYAVNLLNASGAVGSGVGLCGGDRSGIFLGGGLPPSPVTGTVPIDGKPVTVMIGGIDRSGAVSSPIGAQRVTPVIAPTRSRLFWYQKGDQ